MIRSYVRPGRGRLLMESRHPITPSGADPSPGSMAVNKEAHARRTQELEAARQINRELMTRLNRQTR